MEINPSIHEKVDYSSCSNGQMLVEWVFALMARHSLGNFHTLLLPECWSDFSETRLICPGNVYLSPRLSLISWCSEQRTSHEKASDFLPVLHTLQQNGS